MRFPGRRRRESAAPATDPESPAAPDEAAPGWDAIDRALAPHYGSEPAQHVGYQPPAAFSTNLQGCSAFAAGDHWFYVTYGLSELYTPGPEDDPDWSGWGFELTMRTPRGSGATVPAWPFTMLNEMAKHINDKQVLLEPGHRIDLRSPVTGYPHTPDGSDTELTVLAFALDPLLGQIDTPNGKVVFLAAVGVTGAEKEDMLTSTTTAVLNELAKTNPLLLTDPHRDGR